MPPLLKSRNAREEDVFEIGVDRVEAVAWRFGAIDMNQRPAGDELGGDDAEARIEVC